MGIASEITSRRHSSPSPPPMDYDDLLREILLRLPPQPSSLRRASAVCKRWRLLVSDPRFLRRFRIHHRRRRPPLLGYFLENISSLSFASTMEAPNRVPPVWLPLRFEHRHSFQPLGCRHGLALISDHTRQQFLVWDPVTGDQHEIAFPVGFDLKPTTRINGAVLRAAAGDHFRVVFLATGDDGTQPGQQRALACTYSSETGVWGDMVSTPIPSEPDPVDDLFYRGVSTTPSVLVGDSLYWQLQLPDDSSTNSILEFDLENQSLAVIRVPDGVSVDNYSFTVTRADGGGLGFLFVSDLFTAQLWERSTGCDGAASWVLGRTIELDKLLSLHPELPDDIMVLGFAEENDMVFLRAAIGHVLVDLKSLQFKKLSDFNNPLDYYPFESVYTAGNIMTSQSGYSKN
ncbi:hypothetical protein ACQ4PT_040204 [Festuca glaucescens]